MTEFVSILERLRPGYKVGGVVTTPKRGFVDEPGSYAGSLSKDQIKLLKDNLTKEEFAKLDFTTKLKNDALNYGIRQRDDRALFDKVRRIVDPYQAVRSTTSQIFDDPVLVKRITKLAKEGKTSNEIFNQLKNLKNFPEKYRPNNIASAINELVRQGKIPEKFKKEQSSGRTLGENVTRKQQVLDIVDEAIRQKKPLPSLNKIKNRLGFKTYSEVGLIIKKARGENFYKDNFKNMQDLQKKRILKVAGNTKVQAALANGTILDGNNPKYVAKLLGVNIDVAGSVLYDMQQAYAGEKSYLTKNELPKINGKKGFNKIKTAAEGNPFDNPLYAKSRDVKERKLTKKIGEAGNIFSKARRKVQTAASTVLDKLGLSKDSKNKKFVGVATDEIATISVPTKFGGEGYSVFQQVLVTTGNKTIDDVNLRKAKQLDRKLLNIREKITDRTVTSKDINLYNQSVKKIVNDINQSIPKGSKKVQAITITENGDPRNTVKNLDEIKKLNPTAYKNIMEDAKNFKVSYNIGKDVENVYTLQNKKKLEGQILEQLKKGFEVDTEEQLKNTINKIKSKPKGLDKIKQIFRKNIRRVADSNVNEYGYPLLASSDVTSIPSPTEGMSGTTKAIIGAGAGALDIALNKAKLLKKGLTGLAALDSIPAQLAYASQFNPASDSPLMLGIPAALSTEALAALTPGKSAALNVAKAALRGMPQSVASRVYPFAGRLGVAGIYATPFIEAGRELYKAKKMKNRIKEYVDRGYEGASEEFKEKATNQLYQNQISLNTPEILGDDEVYQGQDQASDIYQALREAPKEEGLNSYFNGGIVAAKGVIN